MAPDIAETAVSYKRGKGKINVVHLTPHPFVRFLSPPAHFWSFQINMDMDLGYMMLGTFAKFLA